MRFLILILLTFSGVQAQADSFFIDRVTTKGEFKSSQIQKFSGVLNIEARKVLEGQITATKSKAATIIKPSLIETVTGTKLVLQRYDMGELFSTIEIPELEAEGEISWNRVCARGLRDLVYGSFRQPTPAPQLPVAKR